MSTDTTEQTPCMQAEPQAEHRWLQQLVGEWEYETGILMGPDRPLEKCTGSESVRPLGSLWILAEGQGEMPDGGTAATLLTLGYNPQEKVFVGTWIGSMMTHLWVYRGTLDTGENTLVLDTEGPDMTVEGKLAKYRDVIRFESNDRRTLTSHVLGDNGVWQVMMTTSYRRKQ